MVKRVGPYEVQETLGRGGMGIVARAVDTRTGHDVALKLLVVADERSRRRLVREARALARLRHDNIVPIIDAGEHEGRPWLAMELVRGSSLQARLDRDGPLPPKEAAAVVASVARGIVHAHRRGVLHRDLKPSNVILPDKGEPRVVDFGLASLVHDLSQSALTRTGAILGSPGYWAPEQATGRKDQLGPATDVYGLGALLYAALGGRPPVQGDTFLEIIAATVSTRPGPTGADEVLDAIALRCLEKRPEERYASADALVGELWRYLFGDSAPAPSSTRVGRRRVVVGAGVLVAGSALALAATALPGRERPSPARVQRGDDGVPGPRPTAALPRLRRALIQREQAPAALRDEAHAIADAAPDLPMARVLANASDALALACEPGERPLDEVVARIESAIAASADDQELQRELCLGAAVLLERRARFLPAAQHARRARDASGRVGSEAALVDALVLRALGRKEAMAQLEQVASADPESSAGLLARALLAVEEGHAVDAVALAQWAVDQVPSVVMARRYLAEHLLLVGRTSEARVAVDQHLAAVPDDQAAHQIRARLLAQLGAPSAALAELDRAIELGEPEPDPAALLARAKLRMDMTAGASRTELTRALLDLDRAIALRPDAETWLTRGLLRFQLGDAPAAKADCREAFARDPWRVATRLRALRPPLSVQLSEALELRTPLLPLALGAAALTREVDARLVERANAVAEPARALVLEALRNAARGEPWREVETLLARAASLAEEDANVALERVRLAVARGDVSVARDALVRARRLGASGPELDRLQAEILLRDGSLSRAARRYDRLAADGEDVECLVARAEAQRLVGRRAAALAAVEQAISLAPTHPAALALHGELLLAQQPPDIAGALEAATRGLAVFGATDVRLALLRVRCTAATLFPELRDGASGPVEPAIAQRILVAFDEMIAIVRMAGGGGPLLGVADVLIDAATAAPSLQQPARQLIAAARTLQDKPLELDLVAGRLALLEGRRAETVLERWGRARRAEPLLQLQARDVAAFLRAHGPRPELDALLDDR